MKTHPFVTLFALTSALFAPAFAATSTANVTLAWDHAGAPEFRVYEQVGTAWNLVATVKPTTGTQAPKTAPPTNVTITVVINSP